MQGWSKGPIYTGIGMLLGGGLLIFLGWNGAASYDRVPAQIPYLISGGLGGLALVGVGGALIVVHAVRRDLARVSHQLERLVEAVQTGAGTGLGPTVVPDDSAIRVVAGRTTYHRPTCRVIEGRADLQVMATPAARDRGLAPCRICQPREDTA
ncbi:MAG TPA: hypothetical protein VHF25_05500 [Nitriliruptorales bacterium]|nr:hypothetical protein [Nitriliruptorales bacterium]